MKNYPYETQHNTRYAEKCAPEAGFGYGEPQDGSANDQNIPPLLIADVGVVAVVGVVVRVAVALLILHTHTSTSSQLYYATENNMNIIYNCTTHTKNTQVQLHCDTVNWTVNWDMASHNA